MDFDFLLTMNPSTLAKTKGLTDATLRVQRNKLYPKQAWYCLALFIFIVGVFQWASYIYSKFAKRKRGSSSAVDPELASTPLRRRISLRRIPLFIVNMYRVIAFRWTLEIGQTYTLNLAEVFVIMAYIVFLYVWAFINSKYFFVRALLSN